MWSILVENPELSQLRVNLTLPIAMNIKAVLPALLLFLAMSATAEDSATPPDSAASKDARVEESSDPAPKNELPLNPNQDLSHEKPDTDGPAQADPVASSEFSMPPGFDADRLKELLVVKPKRPGVLKRVTGVVVRCPIIEGLIPRRPPPGASLGKKILNLPVVRLFAPQPMPEPPGGGHYFLWSEPSTRPWASVAAGVPVVDPADPITHEPAASFISVSK